MSGLTVSPHILEHYADYYVGEDAHWRAIGAVEKTRNILALCANIPHQIILEIGAGDGSVLEGLAREKFGSELRALEISRSGIETILKKSIPQVVSVELFDGYEIPYRDGMNDLVVLSHVIEHVEYPRRLLAEAGRVGKYLFVEVPLEDNLRLAKDFIPDRTGHINFFSPRTFRRLLQTSGFRILGQIIANRSKASYIYLDGTRGYFKFWIKEGLLRLFPSLAVSLFTYHMALICQKQ